MGPICQIDRKTGDFEVFSEMGFVFLIFLPRHVFGWAVDTASFGPPSVMCSYCFSIRLKNHLFDDDVVL